jgi:hypothetical protein
MIENSHLNCRKRNNPLSSEVNVTRLAAISTLAFLCIAVVCSAEREPSCSLSPELYAGATLVSHQWSAGLGGVIGGGVRYNNRHYVGLDMDISRDLPALDSDPETNTLFGMRASYYFAPLVVGDLLKGEIGFALAYGSDAYREYHGSWGVPARLSIGNDRIGFYVDGFVNVTYVSDLLGDFYNTPPYLASVSTGVKLSLW